MKPSQRIQSDLDQLVEFRRAFLELVNGSKYETGSLWSTSLVPAGDEREWRRQFDATSIAAGAAQASYDRLGGGVFTLKNAAYILNNVNPVTNWQMAISDPEQMKPEMVISAVDTAIGHGQSEYLNALGRERGLVGLIAAFLRWPQTLREAVGPGPGRRAASAIGFVGQIVVGALSAVLAAGLTALIVQLWGLLF